jgi:hypothetical protein
MGRELETRRFDGKAYKKKWIMFVRLWDRSAH